MQIVTFYRDTTDESANRGRTFILPAGEDLDRVAEDSGFYSYRVLRRELDHLELTSIEVLGSELFGVAFQVDKPV